eukprot:TRINITY_DN4694_c0_g1_i1.p1 TRINITY_DN4694_c0_g1~~TRINITY_DN4694_c0_g1_i1.p1  ORF type:complete len:206 (+),score=38.56 TRINITY_DN4694_c0_g1_i1:78-695(+)
MMHQSKKMPQFQSSAKQQAGVNPITGEGYAPSPKDERPGKKSISGRNGHASLFDGPDSPLRFQTSNVMSDHNTSSNLGKWGDDLLTLKTTQALNETEHKHAPKPVPNPVYEFIVRTSTSPGHFSFSTHNTHSSGASRVVSEKGDTVVLNLFFTNCAPIGGAPQRVTFLGSQQQPGDPVTVKIAKDIPFSQLQHNDRFTVQYVTSQ